MRITYDPTKRDINLGRHGLDLEWASVMLDGPMLDILDVRRDYGEDRFISVGHLDDRMVVCVRTARGRARHIISLRKANAREQALDRDRLAEG